MPTPPPSQPIEPPRPSDAAASVPASTPTFLSITYSRLAAAATALEPALSAFYDWCLRVADWTLAHRASVIAIGSSAVLLTAVAINRLVLHDFPNSGDEYVYLYQAATLAAGRLWNEAPAEAQAFAFNYIVQQDHRLWGSFPVGWPILLAAAMLARVPVWLVNPLVGTLSVLLAAWLGARLYNGRVGVLAAITIAVSPFFLFNAASYFSHTLCGALLLGAAVVAAREDRSPPWVPLAVGFLIGWAVMTRYHTGVICGAAVVGWLLRPGVPRPRALAWCAAGGLPWMVLLFVYNAALNGSPWQLTTLPITYSRWFAAGWPLRGADIMSTQLLRFVLWSPPLLIIVYFVYLRIADRAVRRGTLDWVLVLMAATLYFYVERGGNQYGPRFYYEAFLFLVVFVAANLFKERAFRDKPPRERVLFGLVAASVAVMPVWFVAHVRVEEAVIAERTDPYFAVRDAGLTQALVFIGGRVGTRRSMGAKDLTRNGIDFSAGVLYGLDISPADNCRVSARYPMRRPYMYVWDGPLGRGRLAPLVCPDDAAVPVHG